MFHGIISSGDLGAMKLYTCTHVLFLRLLSFLSFFYQKRQNERDFEFSLLQRLESMADGMGSLEHRMQSLTEQTAKLEKMMLHFAHEQEKYLEPTRSVCMHLAISILSFCALFQKKFMYI